MTTDHSSAKIINPVKKPPLILIHGFRGAPAGLKAIADDLRSAGYEVRLPAVPPFAGAPTLSAYTPEAYARFIANYIRDQQLVRPVLIGHSMGSIVAAATASLHPELVHHKLILMAPISNRTPKAFSLVAPLQNLVPRQIVDYVTTRYLFIPHDHRLFRQTINLTRECSSNCPPSHRLATAATKFSTQYSIADFSLPQDVLLLTGQKDRVVSPKNTDKLAAKLRAKTIYLDDSGHLHNYEKPHETATVIIKFLEN